MPTVIANPVPGLYGHSGWLDDTGIRTLLRPLTASGSECSDYARVQGIGSAVAERLLALLPAEQLEDRQNNAPALGDLLSAAVAHPGVRLCGYMIAPPRWDERLTIDAVLVPASDLLPGSGPLDADRRSGPAALGTGSPTEGVGAPDGAGALRLMRSEADMKVRGRYPSVVDPEMRHGLQSYSRRSDPLLAWMPSVDVSIGA